MASSKAERIQELEAKLAAAEQIIAALRPTVSGGAYLDPGPDLYVDLDDDGEFSDYVVVRSPALIDAFREWIRLGGRVR